ncbi:MAG: PTS sugar transporter subunit IIA [Kiritimatiellae bacterium]|nr:PTS sugar transporter subunit IIA [Kiritimatiellia bacterium]MBP5226859.1 PTS sugar transporter subunit IIA [Kiritimatiellia bacterium]
MSESSQFIELVNASLVCLNRSETDGEALLAGLVDEAVAAGVLSEDNRRRAFRAVLNRERSASTALSGGVALPHGRMTGLERLVCIFAIHPQGVAFGAPDGEPVRIFVMLLVPVEAAVVHVQFLAHLGRCLGEQSVRNDLLAATCREDVIRAILSHVEEGTVE